MLSDESSWSESTDDDSTTRDSASGDAASQANSAQRAYAAASRFDRQRRIHDLFPSRYLTISLAVVAGLLATGLVELLHAWAGSLTDVLSGAELSALDLDSPRNVSRWFAAILLGLASLSAMFIYSLRRHRVDDYHGRYRVWISTAIACLLASLVETSSAGALAQGLCRRAAEASGLSETVVWPLTIATLLSAVAIRLLFEIWRCRLAVTVGLASAAAFALAAAVDHGMLEESGLAQTPLERGSWLIGYVLLLGTFLLYGRHVNREIEGLIVVPPAKARRPKVKKAKKVDAAQTRVDPPQKKPAPHLRTDLDSDDAAETTKQHTAGSSKGGLSDRVLSRAERRRSRREAA